MSNTANNLTQAVHSDGERGDEMKKSEHKKMIMRYILNNAKDNIMARDDSEDKEKRFDDMALKEIERLLNLNQ